MRTGILVLLILLGGCSSNVKIPAARFSTSETQGIAGGTFEMGGRGAFKLSPSPDLTTTPVDKSGGVESSAAFSFYNALGFLNWLDFELEAGLHQPLLGALKLQFLGEPESSAGAGNFSVASRLGYAFYVAGRKEPGHTTAEGSDREYTVDMGGPLFELLLGYRLIDALLIYGGWYRQDYSYALDFNTGIKDVIKHRGKQTGIHLGAAYRLEPLVFKLNATKTEHELKSTQMTKDSLLLLASLGISW